MRGRRAGKIDGDKWIRVEKKGRGREKRGEEKINGRVERCGGAVNEER